MVTSTSRPGGVTSLPFLTALFLYFLLPEAAILAQAQPTECPETALAHYNKTEGMDFALVKAVELNVIVCSGIWFRVNFEAKARDAHWADPNLFFFAELTLAGPNKIEVKCCVPMNLNESGGISCMFCHSMGKEIFHPAQGLQRGFTSTDVRKPRIYLLNVNSDGMFEFEMQASRPPRGPVHESKGVDKAYHKHCTNLAKIALAHYNKQRASILSLWRLYHQLFLHFVM